MRALNAVESSLAVRRLRTYIFVVVHSGSAVSSAVLMFDVVVCELRGVPCVLPAS